MGSPYLKSNESIILSTNNVIVNSVPAEAILTNERLMLVDTRSAELRPLDIPFQAIETVTVDENADSDPMLSLSLVTEPGVTQTLGIVFPQQPRMRRVAERDEWAARIRDLNLISAAKGERTPVKILPPWVPGEVSDEKGEGAASAALTEAESKFRNPPLTPRRPQKSAALQNHTVISAVVIVMILIALAAVAYLYAPAFLGPGTAPPVTPVPTTVVTPIPTILPTTVIVTPEVTPTTRIPVTTAPAVAELLVPQNGVWLMVKYEGSFSGSAGAPGRFRIVNATGNHIYQIPARDEIVTATIQKQDNSGRRLTLEFYEEGKLVKSGSVTAPSGIVILSADLRTV